MTRATRHDAAAVAIYARYSTDWQDARSIDDQVRRCRAFAEARGFAVAGAFKDAAESGAHLDRADLQRLLTEARSPRCRFQTVLVDDLSRLSRDLGNTWQIVFRDLATAHVRVIDLSTGMASDSAGVEARPDPAQVRRRFDELTSIIDQAPERAREAAHRLLTEITLTPTIEDGEEVYEAVGGVKTSSAAHLGGRVLLKDGCGGRI